MASNSGMEADMADSGRMGNDPRPGCYRIDFTPGRALGRDHALVKEFLMSWAGVRTRSCAVLPTERASAKSVVGQGSADKRGAGSYNCRP